MKEVTNIGKAIDSHEQTERFNGDKTLSVRERQLPGLVKTIDEIAFDQSSLNAVKPRRPGQVRQAEGLQWSREK
ncbi:MAG: hypothetical protein R2941_01110 [Desulfobacterales bacterium]